MGWNAGYTIFESTVIGAYDLGVLNKELLSVLMEPYRGTDIDEGGARGLTSKDGKSAELIAVEVWGLPLLSKPLVPYGDDSEAWDRFHDCLYDSFSELMRRFGWR